MLSVALLLLPQGYATPLTIAEKDVTLPEICAEIAKDSGIKVELGDDLWNFKVTVFVKDMKARDLLDRIASLYDLDGTALSDRYRLKLNFKAQKAFEDYVQAECLLRELRMVAQAKALAKLTLKPFGDPSAAIPPKNAGEAEKWAAKHIGEPAYYALGLWERACELQEPQVDTPDYWTGLVASGSTILFWVGEPPVPPPPALLGDYAKNFMDDNSKALGGTVVTIGSYEMTSDLQISVISGSSSPQIACSDRPFLFARPPKELEKMPFSVQLTAWQTSVDPSDLGEVVENPKQPKAPGYFDHRISLSEKLENLYNRCGAPIVATSFRAPALRQGHEATPAAILADLTQNEEVFTRWDHGCLLVRHPAYWLLECTEPVESTMREAEAIAKKRPLTVDEYAALARKLGPGEDDDPPWLHVWNGPSPTFPNCFDRLINGRGFLSRFDPEPLEKAFPALFILGMMSNADFQRLANGETLDAAQVWPAGSTLNPADLGGPYKKVRVGGKTILAATRNPSSSSEHPEFALTFNVLPEWATNQAPLFGARIGSDYVRPPEWRGELYPSGGITDQRAEFISMEKQDDGTVLIRLANVNGLAATYSFAIHPNPSSP